MKIVNVVSSKTAVENSDRFNFRVLNTETDMSNNIPQLEINRAVIGIIADLHTPYINTRLLNYMISVMKERNVTNIILLGDYIDSESLSTFSPKQYHMFKEELRDARRLIKPLADYLQNMHNVYYIEGNHEERYRKAIANSLKELVDVVPDLNEILAKHDLIPKNTKYIIVKEHGFLKIDRIYFMHGHEMGNKSAANPSQALIRKAGTSSNILFGHFHKYGIELFNNINDKMIFALSMPMAGDKRVRYIANPQFHNGFGIYNVEKEGGSTLDVYVISESGRKIKELVTSIK